jgi:ferredoxin, 2Fe-2S
MPMVSVTTRTGAQYILEAQPRQPLMELLRDSDAGIDGICGGECSCGTCHVYIDQGGELLSLRSEDEQAMLDAIGEFVEIRDTSRLSCQVTVPESSAGLKVTVGPVP